MIGAAFVAPGSIGAGGACRRAGRLVGRDRDHGATAPCALPCGSGLTQLLLQPPHTRGGSRCHAAKDLATAPLPPNVVMVQDPNDLDEQGKPRSYLINYDDLEPVGWLRDDLVEGLERYDVSPLGRAQLRSSQVEIPGTRVIRNQRELDLIGDGLPVINGDEWPEVYWDINERLAAGQEVPVPVPHGKFTLADMTRIASEGPRFSDLVLTHAEVDTLERQSGTAYNYVPFTVLGDYHYRPEPDWLQVRQASVTELLSGLQARNWTHPTFDAGAEPWRVQFFTCNYEAVSHWGGYRALITDTSGEQFWVAMPRDGPDTHLRDYKHGDGGVRYHVGAPPLDIGWKQVFEQVFQAYEQRLPLAAAADVAAHGAVHPAHAAYDCPGEHYLDVSWHRTAQPYSGWWVSFLVAPSWGAAVSGIRSAIQDSGVFELKLFRDIVLQSLPRPQLPEFQLPFDMASGGSLYFFIVIGLGILLPTIRRARILDISTLEEDFGAAQEFSRSKADARREGLTGVKFDDVAGLAPVLAEVMEVVEFLRDPRLFSKLGARPPKGVLFEGDPGTGKTLLAKALAGEAMVPFYSQSGTEFTEGIVGLGAARVRDLFKRARGAAPCVIFVDEIDALGLKRSDANGRANEEREQTLNQLLTEMDGFTPDTGVVFIAATNRADMLDPALLRPGRFDRKIRMPKPDTEGRYDILKLLTRNKQLAADVDLEQLSRDLPGLVGADLANVINEANLNAVRDGRTTINVTDIYNGVDRFTQGEKRLPVPRTYTLPIKMFSAREVGTALVATVLRDRHGRIEPVERVSVQPRGRSTSRTLFARGLDEDYLVMTRGRMLDRIRVTLAGHIAVRLVVGEDTLCNKPEIQHAHVMAEKFFFYYGMSNFGITTWAKTPWSTRFMIGSNQPRKVTSGVAMDALADWPTESEDARWDPMDPSDVTWWRYQDEVRKILRSCYLDAWTILEEGRDALWAGVDALARQGQLLGPQLNDIFRAHPLVPLEEPLSLDMLIATSGRNDSWPYGIEWLDDAYPTPHWVRQRRQKEEASARPTASPSAAP